MNWLKEVRSVFRVLNKKTILADYKKMSRKKLGFVRSRIKHKIDFDAVALLLGKSKAQKIQKTIVKPNEFEIFINQDLQKIKKEILRKEIVQHILIHELLHIENEDLITISKNYNKRKKKKIHINKFDEEIFNRYNKLRKLKGIMQIQKREYLDMAIKKILKSVKQEKIP
ncbi:MAG: hypothetical protein B6U87_01860 [Candidatus Aenigmarchaeota archaeon ex4484_52]|nr:MAG: hypothetical protein B6U87_01860 [Candidatus Aenigmarchaeota archaeon ex4484_52]